MVFSDFLIVGKEREATELRRLAVDASRTRVMVIEWLCACAAKVKHIKANVSTVLP